MSTVRLARITKVYDGAEAVRDFDLTIDDGQLVVLVGPPGSGKSTLLRIIAGLEAPSAGDVLVDGERVNQIPPENRDIALVTSNAFHRDLTVAENLGFPLRLAGIRRRCRSVRVDAIAHRLGLGDVLGQRPQELSRSQRQRMALARSLIWDPQVLLVDDILSPVEMRPRAELRTEIRRIQRSRRLTTVVATRDPVDAMAMADRIVVLRNGRVVQSGPPEDIYDRPVDLFVAWYMGPTPMNIVCATVVATLDGLGVSIGGHVVAIDPLIAQKVPDLTRWAGRQIACGFRPEALHCDPHGSFVAGVESVDALRSGGQLVRAWIAAPRVTPSDSGILVEDRRRSIITVQRSGNDETSPWKPLHLKIDCRELHLFDLSTGASIAAPAKSSFSGRRRSTPVM